MDKNIDNCIFSDECKDSEINWVCKICKDLPQYAGRYLELRKYEKNKAHNKEDQYTDLKQMKYYYALLHLLDEIHNLPVCSNSECFASESADQKCLTPEHFDRYRKLYNAYEIILMSEKELEKINLKCDICAVLPYALFNDLDRVAKNMHNEDIEKTQKLELDAIVTDYYLDALGSCEQWEKCPNGADWLELMNSVFTLKKYLETKDRKALSISLSGWNKLRAIDNLLNSKVKTTYRDFQTQDIPLCMLKDKALVYLDFGVYQLYENNEIFRTQLDIYTEMEEIQFVYSPTHMEEVCRMENFIFESKRRENISKICDDCEILPVRDGYLKVLMEPVDVCFARAKKFQDVNRNAEEFECATFEALEEQTCKLLGWNEKEMEKHRKEISALTSIQLFNPQNEAIDNGSLNQVFCEICGSRVLLEEFKDYIKKEKTFLKLEKRFDYFIC